MSITFPSQSRLKFLFVATVLAAAIVEGTAVLAQQGAARQRAQANPPVTRLHEIRSGRGAFLPYQVGSTDEIVAVLETDPKLRASYARHFGIPEDKVIAFVKNALIPFRLPQATRVTNYGIRPNGTIFGHETVLPKGTRVWGTRSGTPILKWACANPLTKNMPGTLLPGTPVVGRPKNIDLGRRPTAIASSSLLAPVVPDVPTGEIVVPAFIAPDAVDTAVADVIPVPKVAIPVASNIRNFLPLLPLVLAIPRGGGSTPRIDTPPNAVPEPGTFALFAAAGLPVAVAAVRRRAK